MNENEPCPDCDEVGEQLPNGEMACMNEECSVGDYQHGIVIIRH